MLDLVEVRWQYVDGTGNETTHLHTTKTTPPFLITFTNDLNQDGSLMDIYIQYHHSIHR